MADCSVPFSRPPPPIVAVFSLKNITVRAVGDGTDDVRCVYPRLAHSVTTGVRPIPDTLDIRRSSCNSNSFQPKSPQRRSEVQGNNPSRYASLLERYRCPTTIPGSPGWGMYHCRHMPTYPGPVINGDKAIALVTLELGGHEGLTPWISACLPHGLRFRRFRRLKLTPASTSRSVICTVHEFSLPSHSAFHRSPFVTCRMGIY